MLGVRFWPARHSSTSGFLFADCTPVRRPYGRVRLATPALLLSFVLAKVKWLPLRYEARQFRRKQHRKLATGRSCVRSANRLGHSYVRAVRFSGSYSTLVRLPGGSAHGTRSNTIRVPPYCREYIRLPGPHVQHRRRWLIKSRSLAPRDRQYTSPRFCQTAPGDRNTPVGRRKTRFESHIAVNTLVHPGWMFTVIEVGSLKLAYGTLCTVKTCGPAGNHA
jgi:hypothetical protein